MICEKTDFIYPMLVDVYHPFIEQDTFGNVTKIWVLDRTVAGNFESATRKNKQEIIPNINVIRETMIMGRTKSDIRITSSKEGKAMTNVVLTNIRDKFGNAIYVETSGPRSGKSTVFEIATQEPQMSPFGHIDFYSLVLRRSESQSEDI